MEQQRMQLTSINQELVGDAWMVYVMDGSGKDGSKNLQISENSLLLDRETNGGGGGWGGQ